MAAGAFAGIAEHTVMYPIDAIKTRMQIISPQPGAVYNGMIQGTYRIATSEGIRNLWRGMSSVVVGAGPAHAVYFATYEAVKHLMGGNKAGEHHPLAAGLFSTHVHFTRAPPADRLLDSHQRRRSHHRQRCAHEPL